MYPAPIDDALAHEWAEFNLPAELRRAPAPGPTPFGRRVIAAAAQPANVTAEWPFRTTASALDLHAMIAAWGLRPISKA